MSKIKKVSVIIPTLDRDQVLVKTLSDLVSQKYPDFEIIVIDQTKSQSKAVTDLVKKNQDVIKYLAAQSKGSPGARNLGVSRATGEILLFVDDDVEINDHDFISRHVKNYDDPAIGLVGGRVVYDWADRGTNRRDVGKLKCLGMKETTNFNSTQRVEIDHAYGCNFSCLKEVYLKVGGYGEIYKGNAHMEETDLSLRIKRAGYKLIFDPTAVLLHVRASSGGNRVTDLYEFRYWLVHNSTVFYLKNYPRLFFPLFWINKYCWAVTSAAKRRDGKMFKTMTSAMKDAIVYYNSVTKQKNDK